MIADSTVLFDCRRLQKYGGCVSPNITKSSLLSPNPPRFPTKTNHPLGSIQKVTVFETHQRLHFGAASGNWALVLWLVLHLNCQTITPWNEGPRCRASPVASSWTSLCLYQSICGIVWDGFVIRHQWTWEIPYWDVQKWKNFFFNVDIFIIDLPRFCGKNEAFWHPNQHGLVRYDPALAPSADTSSSNLEILAHRSDKHGIGRLERLDISEGRTRIYIYIYVYIYTHMIL